MIHFGPKKTLLMLGNKTKSSMTILTYLLLFVGLQNSFASDLESRADAIVSIFENGTPEIQYDSIANIQDGRGYTAGKAGFTTANGDLLEVVIRYLKISHDSQFKPLQAILAKRAKAVSGNVKGLEKLPQIWKDSCLDSQFIGVQDQLVNDWYKTPARDAAKRFHLHSSLAYLILYDSFIQHGDGEDPDSVSGILSKMTSQDIDEKKFLLSFLKARIQVLQNPADSESRDVWRESVDRVHALERLVNQNIWDLEPPFQVTVWDTDFSF